MRLAATLTEHREQAFLFRTLATLRTDALVGASVDALEWKGPSGDFERTATALGDTALAERAQRIARTR
jgi:hypothetical protein